MTDDLKFAGNLPVVINRNGDTRDIYNPIRSSSCDITVVSNKILSDLYTNDKKGIKVKVEKYDDYIGETSVLFEGYMTPNSYSQKLSPNLDNIDMTAIDPLAVLKYLYVDDIMEKAKSITMGELIARALAAVKIDCNDLLIEDTVRYIDAENVNYNFVDLVVQTSNFWDEGDDPSSVYDVVSECLRLFGYTLTFTGERYMIYNVISDHTFGTNYRYFNWYKIEDGGTLYRVGTPMVYKKDHQFKHSDGEWTTIDDNPSVSIDNTYDKISGVASTKIPNYSMTAFDLVSADNRDMYDAGDLNVERNKVKGYKLPSAYYEGGKLITDPEWYYIWNGVYINPDYELDIEDTTLNGYANINNAYAYMSGQTGHPNASGAILNFYGGEENLVGTDRDPQEERVVEVDECITVFAPDNGIAPEFLERDDLKWILNATNINSSGNADLDKWESALGGGIPSKFGVNKTTPKEGISYKQIYENITISKEAEQTLVIDLTQKYSRTGFNKNISISGYSDMTSKYYSLSGDGDGGWSASFSRGTAYIYPSGWQSSAVSVGYGYFNKYLAYDNGKNYNGLLIPVWDRRKVMLYMTLPDGTKYQFNGLDWVKTDYITHDNAFYLKKLMNHEKLFHTEHIYNLIDLPKYNKNGVLEGYTTYGLNEECYIHKTDKHGGVLYTESFDEDNDPKYPYYAKSGTTWKKYIDECDDGRLAIILPPIDSINATLTCEIYHSSLLGTTGNSSHSIPSYSDTVYYSLEGTVEYYDDNGEFHEMELHEGLIGENQYIGEVVGTPATPTFAPVNATYIKAEHLNLDISLSVPESNLGQMFGESDIRYSTNHSKKFREAYDAPTFMVNTKHPIVAQSHSYVMVGNALANANKFSIGWMSNKLSCRPENYVMQGYKNYWGVIRRTYNRVLVPNKAGFSNCLCFIEAPDIPDVGNGRWLMVVSDSWDVRTNRHTISAVEDYNLNVNEIENYTVLEIPRQSRNPRFDLPSVQKRKS